MNNNKYLLPTLMLLVIFGFGLANFVFAQTNPASGFSRGGGQRGGAPGVFGTVTAINGDTITINSKGFGKNSTQATYTVDATNAKVTKNNVSSSVSSIAVGDTLMVQGTVSGTSVSATSIRDGVIGAMNGAGNRNGVSGTVASVSGNTFTVTSKTGANGGTTTYTVDASNATVTKNGAASSVSGIAVGDTVMIQGTISGTSVVAKTIRDGLPQNQKNPQQNSVVQGNGQPVIAGSVTVINGNSLTVTNKSNVTYTVDATNAKVTKAGTSSSVSSIVQGDNVIIQGTVNGTSVSASSVIDQGVNNTTGGTPSNSVKTSKSSNDFLGGVVNFFKHLFGF